MDDNTILDETDTIPTTTLTMDWDDDIDVNACEDRESDGVYSTSVNLIPPGDHTNFATDLTGNFEGYEETYGCTECWELYFAGITDECTCGEEYVGCISSLSITNSLIRVESESIELTFDYEVGLTEEVSEDSYILIKISSSSWTDEAHTVFIVSSGNSTASGSKTVVLTYIADSLDSTIQVKFRR